MKQPIPALVEEVYEFLKKEVTWLHGRWIIFEQLYNKSPKRIELLSEAASTFSLHPAGQDAGRSA